MKVSIAMTVYNGENYLEPQLESLLHQTIKPDEVVICDDGSDDATPSIVLNFIQKYSLPNWSLSVNSQNQGYKRNFYNTISKTTGDIIFLCDQDDLWNPSKIECMVNLFNTAPQAQTINSCFDFIDKMGATFNSPNKSGFLNHNLIKTSRKPDKNDLLRLDMSNLLRANISPGCTMAFTSTVRDIYLKESCCEIPHDWELNMIAAALDGLFYYAIPTIQYRIHDHNTLGLADVGPSDTSVKSASFSDCRLSAALQECDSVEYILHYAQYMPPDIFEKATQWKMFSSARFEALRKRSFIDLLKLYRWFPLYCQHLTAKGRLADLLCAAR